MDGFAGSFGSIIGDPQSLMFSLLVFAGTFILVLAAGLHLSRRPKVIDAKPPLKSGLRVSTSKPGPRSQSADPPGHPLQGLANVTATLHKLFRVFAVIAVVTMAALTVALWFASNPNDGSRLMPILLGTCTLILAGHLHNIDRRHRPTGLAQRDLGSGPASRFGPLPGRVSFDFQIGSPEVLQIDQQSLDRAKAMAEEGRPVDEICRTITPEYGQWGGLRQHAYRALVQAAIDHRG